MPYGDRERQLQAYRERYERRKADPDLLEKMRESGRRAARKISADPERRAEINRRSRARRTTETAREYARQLIRKRRIAAIEKYGGVCVRCGFSDIRALCIDHVNGTGHIERRSGNCGTSFILKLLREPVSADYQILCANCNYIKAHENVEWAPRKAPGFNSAQLLADLGAVAA